MLNRIFIIIFLFIFCQNVNAETPIYAGIINGDTLNVEGSPYIVQGNLTIKDLTIEPGVIVKFAGNYKFEVDGVLKAKGFYSDSIYFQPDPENSSGWHGIDFLHGSSYSSLAYCRIEGTNEHGISVNNGNVEISNCRIIGNDGDGLLITDTPITLNNCIISDNGGSGMVLNAVELFLLNSIIVRNNSRGIYSIDSDDIINLINAVIVDNGGTGISCQSGQLTIKNSIVYYNANQIYSDDELTNVSYSNIQDFPDTSGNISTPPNFVDHQSYTLSDTSLCKDSGDPNYTYNDKYFPPSLGNNRNDMGAYGGPQAFGWYPPFYLKPQIMDFGITSQELGKSINLHILNYRDTDITNLNILIDGPDSLFFNLEDGENFSVPVYDSAELMVTFNPNEERAYSGSMTFLTESHGKVFSTLTGEGVVSQIDTLIPQLNFEIVTLGDSSTLVLPIQNLGGDTLRINLNSPSNPVYSLNETAFKILPYSTSDIIHVTFKPDSPKVYLDTLVILSNDFNNPHIDFPLIGEGRGPIITLDQEILDFGSVSVDSALTLQLTINNSGNENLIIQNLNITQPDTNFEIFRLADSGISLPINIESDSSKILQIRFKPLFSGLVTGQLQIFSNDPFREVVTVELTGIGLASKITLSDTDLDFGAIRQNSDTSQIFFIYNEGETELIIYHDSLQISGPNFEAFQINNIHSDIIINPDDSTDISVTFHPLILGPQEANIKIYSNDPSDPYKYISLTGIAIDSQAASIAFDSIQSTIPFVYKQPATISFTIQSPSFPDSVILFTKQGGKLEFYKDSLQNPNGGIWCTQIDSSRITERGFEYYINVYHGWTSTLYPLGGDNNPNIIQVSIPHIEHPENTKNKIYQMISVPLITSGQTLSDLYEDNLGSYNKSKYRIFDCENGVDYTELTGMEQPLPPGKALWLITAEEKTMDISNAQSTPTSKNISIQLNSGWNMIATPFAFPIDWDNVSGNIALRFYDGSDWQFKSVLEPFKGYAVYVPEQTTISIPPIESSPTNQIKKADHFALGKGWSIQIIAETENHIDQYNYIGAFESTTANIDEYDYPEPPPIGDYISLYLVSDIYPKHYSTDYRELGADGYSFLFESVSNISKQKVIRFQPENLPVNFDWAVVSTDTKINYPDRIIETSSNKSQFKLIIGTENYINNNIEDYHEIPISFKLYQNYPNPFNPSTTISFELPSRQHISINIFNNLGQHIKTLLTSEFREPGYHTVNWDGTNSTNIKVSSGIYYMQLRTEKFNRSIKMILQR